MYLERAKVTNFRGIRRLSVDFESDSTFLIGENQWGKTSLLRVLWMLLGQGNKLCQFERGDLYVPIKIEKSADFPKENLIEKVSKRKSINFDSQRKEKSRKNDEVLRSDEQGISLCKKIEKFYDENSENNATINELTRCNEDSQQENKDSNTNANFIDELDSYIEKSGPLYDFEKEDVFNTGDGKIRVDLDTSSRKTACLYHKKRRGNILFLGNIFCRFCSGKSILKFLGRRFATVFKSHYTFVRGQQRINNIKFNKESFFFTCNTAYCICYKSPTIKSVFSKRAS